MALSFGSHDDPLDKRGRADCARLRLSLSGKVFVAPDRSATETVAEMSNNAMVDDPVVDNGLAAIDLGRWKGLPPDQVDPAELGLWLSDPSSNPHGGESVTAFVARLEHWLGGHRDADGSAVVAAGTAQGLISAATGADFWSIEVAPAAVIDLEGGRGCWRLRLA